MSLVDSKNIEIESLKEQSIMKQKIIDTHNFRIEDRETFYLE